MRSTRHLKALREFNSVKKRASPGERVMGSLFPSRGGYPGTWASSRIDQVHHFRNWVMVAIDTICCKIASIFPNIAWQSSERVPGVTVKACQRALMGLTGRGLGALPYTGGRTEKLSSWANKKSTFMAGEYQGCGEVWRPDDVSPLGFSDGGHSFLTMGEWRSKALGSVVKPNDELMAMDPGHILVRLMENPNPVDTYFDIEYELQMFEELTGISYEWIPKSENGVPCERWCIPSHWVYPRTGGGKYVPFNHEHADELIWDYEIRPWGYPGYAGVLHFPPDEVIVNRWKSPLSKIDGWSKLAGGAQWIDEEEGISQSRWSQMVNQARPEMLVQLGAGYEDVDDNEIARIEAKFLGRIQGAFNFAKPLIAPPGASVTTLSFTPTEMAYFQSEEQVADMILSLWRVPPAAVGRSKDMTYGAIMGTLGGLCVFCLNPRLAKRGQARTKHLAQHFVERSPAYSSNTGQTGGYSGRAVERRAKIFYDDCVPADPQQVNADLAFDFQAGAVTTNEIRSLRGRQPYRRGGDDPLVSGPGGLMPMPLNTGDDLGDLAELIAPMTKPGEEQAAREGMAEEGLDWRGQEIVQQPGVESPADDEAVEPNGDLNEDAVDSDDATGLEGQEEPNGKPRLGKGLGAIGKAAGDKYSVLRVDKDDVGDEEWHGRRKTQYNVLVNGRATDTFDTLREAQEQIRYYREQDRIDPNWNKQLNGGYNVKNHMTGPIGEVAKGRKRGRKAAPATPRPRGRMLIGAERIAVANGHKGWDTNEDGGEARYEPRKPPRGMVDKEECGPGQTAANTGCTPRDDTRSGSSRGPSGASNRGDAPKTHDVSDEEMDKHIKELESKVDFKKDKKARKMAAKAFKKVKTYLVSTGLESLPKYAVGLVDNWIMGDVVARAATEAGLPGAQTMMSAAAWGASKAWVAAKRMIANRRNQGKGAPDEEIHKSGEEDLDAVVEQVYNVMSALASAAGMDPPDRDDIREKLEKESGHRDTDKDLDSGGGGADDSDRVGGDVAGGPSKGSGRRAATGGSGLTRPRKTRKKK